MSVWAHGIQNRAVRRFLKKLTRFFLRLIHNRIGFPAPSRMTIDAGDRSPRIVGFDARNTGFASLYEAEHAFGYEKSTAALIRHLMPKDGVFYDIGADWGFLSLLVIVDKEFSGDCSCL